MSFTINCRNEETILNCFAKGFSCDVATLTKALANADPSTQEELSDQHVEERLYQLIIEELGEIESAESIHYFHLTRTKMDNDFSAGILPLTESLDILWETLIDCFEDQEIQNNVSEELGTCLEVMVKKVANTAINGLYEAEPEESYRTIMVTYANQFGLSEYWLKVKDIPTKEELNELLGFYAKPHNIRNIHIECIESNPKTATLIRKDGRLSKNDDSSIHEVSYKEF